MRFDAQAFCAHEHGRDHFVTIDDNFRRKLVLTGIVPADVIVAPKQAIAKI